MGFWKRLSSIMYTLLNNIADYVVDQTFKAKQLLSVMVSVTAPLAVWWASISSTDRWLYKLPIGIPQLKYGSGQQLHTGKSCSAREFQSLRRCLRLIGRRALWSHYVPQAWVSVLLLSDAPFNQVSTVFCNMPQTTSHLLSPLTLRQTPTISTTIKCFTKYINTNSHGLIELFRMPLFIYH